METRNHVLEGRTRHHFSPADADPFDRFTIRIAAGTASLIRYLETCDPNLDLSPPNERVD